jgi:hypothetical protein
MNDPFDDLRQWAEPHAAGGHVQARRVLELLAERERLQRQIEGHVERIAAQAELLAKLAEKAEK